MVILNISLAEKTALESATKQVLNGTQISIAVKIFHSWILHSISKTIRQTYNYW